MERGIAEPRYLSPFLCRQFLGRSFTGGASSGAGNDKGSVHNLLRTSSMSRLFQKRSDGHSICAPPINRQSWPML